MHPLTLIAAALGWNYARHRSGKSTVCSVTRQHVPWPAFVAFLCWFAPHWLIPVLKQTQFRKG